MPATFRVHGPFRIPRRGKERPVIESGCPGFWENPKASSFAKERGCYLFAIRAAKGFRPIYVGKTKNSFEKECFTSHKTDHYNCALADIRKGAPVMFLVGLGRGKGPINNRAIAQVESFLIQHALAKNPDLSNTKGTKQEKWRIVGVFRGGKGKVSEDARLFRKAVGLTSRK